MEEIQLNLAELKKIDISFLFLTKEDIKKCWNIKSDGSFNKYRAEFIDKINQKFYPKASCLKIGGKEQFSLYAWMHFASNYDWYQDKRLAKHIAAFTRESVKEYKLLLGDV